jgi:hypothetical protein
MLQYTRATSNSLSLTPVSLRLISFLRSATRTLALTSVASRVFSYIRGTVDNLALVPTASRIGEVLRSTTASLGLAGGWFKTTLNLTILAATNIAETSATLWAKLNPKKEDVTQKGFDITDDQENW